MDVMKSITVLVFGSMLADIRRIQEVERRRTLAETVRLLLASGIRIHRRTGSLLCGYPDCTRKDCCGGERRPGRLVAFPAKAELDN